MLVLAHHWKGEKDVGEDSEVGQSCRVGRKEGGKGREGIRMDLSVRNSESRSAGSTNSHLTGFN